MSAVATRLALAACGVALLGGCSLFKPAEPPMVSALVDQLPADLPQRARSDATVVVLPPEARPAYDTTQMAYALRPHHIAYYSRNQWGERPAQMLQPLLVRTLEETGAFRAVVTTPLLAGSTSYEVHTELLELLQDHGVDPPLLRLSLRVHVGDAATHPLASREFEVTEPMREKSPQGGVAAANAATARALREVAAFVLQQAGAPAASPRSESAPAARLRP